MLVTAPHQVSARQLPLPHWFPSWWQGHTHMILTVVASCLGCSHASHTSTQVAHPFLGTCQETTQQFPFTAPSPPPHPPSGCWLSCSPPHSNSPSGSFQRCLVLQHGPNPGGKGWHHVPKAMTRGPAGLPAHVVPSHVHRGILLVHTGLFDTVKKNSPAKFSRGCQRSQQCRRCLLSFCCQQTANTAITRGR